ncbi:MAG: sugar transferase [Methanomassiliicoccales archaeon]|nr:MAG: sugar transferase [Methanomassiliicoccales archaeon]
MVKRGFDIILSFIGLIFLFPFFIIIAILIKLDSRGPVFYLCDRIGKGGKAFRMYKFRTMIETPVQVGAIVSPRGDVRVTNFGRILRRTKLNELPQLFNILQGEMSWVGPRPEDPDLAELYPQEARVLFSVKPGLVGPAQTVYRNEEDLYPEGVNHADYYIKHILPDKLALDLEYVAHPTLFKDFKYILLAFKETIFGAISRRHFFENRSQIYLFSLDILATFISYLLAMQLRFEGSIPPDVWTMFFGVFYILLFFRISCSICFGLYGVLIRYLNVYNYISVGKAVTVGSILTVAALYLVGYRSFPRSILIIDWLCINTFMIVTRVSIKLLREKFYQEKNHKKRHVLVYGAGDKGNLAATHLKDHASIIGFLDDERSKRNKKIQQYRVIGGRYDIEVLSKIYHIDEVIIAISDLDDLNLSHIISLCNKASVKYSIFTTPIDSFADRMREDYIRTRKIAQWVGSQDFQLDMAQVEQKFREKGILLIGPSSVLGLELLKYLAPLNPGQIAILDRYESYLNETFMRALAFLPKEMVRPYLSSDPMHRAVGKILLGPNPPEMIFYMGTRKYLSSIDLDPLSIVKDNILNSWDLLQMLRSIDGQLLLMVSSIGAAHPANFVQATLRLAEHYLQVHEKGSNTSSAVVRLLDLVENRGSILDRIQQQIRDGGKIILNHPAEERYFFTASSAAKFILLTASLAFDERNEINYGIYIPALNGKVKIVDLARLIIQDYGLDPDKDLEIEYIASDSLEEWKESIELDVEGVQDTAYDHIKRIISPSLLAHEEVVEDIETFRKLVAGKDREALIKKVGEVMNRIRAVEQDEKSRLIAV